MLSIALHRPGAGADHAAVGGGDGDDIAGGDEQGRGTEVGAVVGVVAGRAPACGEVEGAVRALDGDVGSGHGIVAVVNVAVDAAGGRGSADGGHVIAVLGKGVGRPLHRRGPLHLQRAGVVIPIGR